MRQATTADGGRSARLRRCGCRARRPRSVVLLSVLLAGAPTFAGSATNPPPGATACSGCHPAGRAVATSVPALAGRAPAEIVAAVRAFRSGERPATVMNHIAKGFSDDEIAAIAAWYGVQPGPGKP